MSKTASADASLQAIQDGLRRPAWPWLLTLALAILSAALMFRGYDFYSLPLVDRPLHDDYRQLSPHGMLGQGYGVFGTALILTNLLYLVRRRLAKWPLGSIRVWLEIHVFTGLTGSVIILYHSAFQLRTAMAAVTSLSLLLVVITGLFGRYLVGLAPRAKTEKLRENLTALDELMPGMARRVQQSLASTTVTRFATSKSFFATLATLPKWMGEARARKRAVREAVKLGVEEMSLDQTDAKMSQRITKETEKYAAQEVQAEAAISLLRVWRRLHRFFAILMLLSVGVHIGVAWYYGYRWIFSA